MRARASVRGSLTTAMCQPLACKQRGGVAHDADMALPEYEIAARQRRPAAATGSPSAASCWSLSRGAATPAAVSAGLDEP